MKSRILAVAVLAMLTVASSAFAAGKGASMFSIGLGQNQANIVDPLFLGSTKSDETSFGAQYQYMFSDDYAFALSGAFGFGSVKEEDATDEAKATLTSYRLRVGGDRVGKIGDRFTMYMGPGVEYASAKLKYEATGSPELESENATTFGISGRIGGVMMLSDAVGITGEINHMFGMASQDGNTDTFTDGLKWTWRPNTFGAFWGLTFAFGGN